MSFNTLKFLTIIFLAAGCAYIDQNLKVAPQHSIAQENIGKGQKVVLRVVDDRDEQLIGKRKNGYGMDGAKISTDQDLVGFLKD